MVCIDMYGVYRQTCMVCIDMYGVYRHVQVYVISGFSCVAQFDHKHAGVLSAAKCGSSQRCMDPTASIDINQNAPA